MYKNSLKPYGILILAVVLMDQATKSYFVDFFASNAVEFITIFPGLNFVHAWNEGISFGLFSNFEYSNIIFLCLSVVIIAVLIFLLFKEKTRIYSVSYALIIGGAIGNIIDRFNYDAVFDFIDFYIGHYHWPAFNIADSAVCLGVMLLIYTSLKEKH